MTLFEYKVIPAPARGVKAKGVKSAEGRFAHALEQVMNDMAADGWAYQRAETLPSEERSGLTSKTTTFRNVLVFRRERAPETEPAPEGDDPKLLAAPDAPPEQSPDTDTETETADDITADAPNTSANDHDTTAR